MEKATMKVTLDTIAQHTGLSKSTVSRVLSQDHNVKSTTRIIVENAARKLGYIQRPKRAGANPFEKTVLAISRNISQASHVDYYHAISDTMRKQGYITYLIGCNFDVEQEEFYVHHAVSNRFAGIFLFSHFGESNQEYLLADSDVPIILVNNYPRMEDLDVVCLDNYRCGYIATKHLIDLGHQKILHVGWPNASITSRDRARGFLDAMQELLPEQPANNLIIQAELTYQSGYALGEQLAAAPPDATALFFSDSATALGVIDAFSRYGIEVPRDVSVIAAGYSHTLPGRSSLTHVGYDDFALGVEAAKMMLERIHDKGNSNARRRVVLSPMLMQGDSVRNMKP